MTACSILFLMGSSGVGGVERVSVVLANEFVARGLRVTFCAFKYEENNLVSGLDKRVKVVHLKDGWLTAKNRKAFRQVLIDQQVTHIINQWCVPFSVTVFCRLAARGLGTKLIAVHHNIPNTNKRIQDASGLKRKIWQLITAVNLRLVYEFSDAYVLLSESFVDIFKRFVRIRNAGKLQVITNPLTMTPVQRAKENLIVYVGRLEETQKRFLRVLDIWREASKMLPGWRLEVVGDGPDRDRYERDAASLERISFKGYQNPVEYYARAKLLLLTSDFEGFPLVLVEAMASGCVPIALGSYPAAYDVKDGGIILPAPFDAASFVAKIVELAADSKKMDCWYKQSRALAGGYDVAKIADVWESRLLSRRD